MAMLRPAAHVGSTRAPNAATGRLARVARLVLMAVGAAALGVGAAQGPLAALHALYGAGLRAGDLQAVEAVLAPDAAVFLKGSGLRSADAAAFYRRLLADAGAIRVSDLVEVAGRAQPTYAFDVTFVNWEGNAVRARVTSRAAMVDGTWRVVAQWFTLESGDWAPALVSTPL